MIDQKKSPQGVVMLHVYLSYPVPNVAIARLRYEYFYTLKPSTSDSKNYRG